MTRLTTVTTYYVLNGLLDGKRGVSAITCGSGVDLPQPDGHYYLLEGDDDGHGPYPSRDDALEAGERAADTTHWLFAGGELPRPCDPEDGDLDPGDVAKIVRIGDGRFKCELLGSYETLDIYVTCKDYAHAARVFQGALAAMEV